MGDLDPTIGQPQGGSDTTPPGASESGGSTVNWEERFKGLQREFQKLQNERKAPDAKPESKPDPLDLEAAVAKALEAQTKQFEAKLAEALTPVQQQLEATRTEAERLRNLRQTDDAEKVLDRVLSDEKYRHLREVRSLVKPDADEASLRSQLDNLDSILKPLVDESTRQRLAGTTPNVPPAGDMATLVAQRDQLFQRATEAAGTDEYGVLWQQYLEALNMVNKYGAEGGQWTHDNAVRLGANYR